MPVLLFRTLFLFVFVFPSLLFSQDCADSSIDYSRVQEVGDSIYLTNLLSQSDGLSTVCQLRKLSSKYFDQFDYKQAILYSAALENIYQSNVPLDSNLILKNWEILSNSYHEMGLPDSVLVYGKKLLFALDQKIALEPKQLPRILEVVAMSYIDKLQYDLAMEWVDLIGYHLMAEGMEGSELFAGMLYVKGVVRTMQDRIEDAAGLMDSIQVWYTKFPKSNNKTLARAHTLNIRLNLFLGNDDGLVFHIDRAKNLLDQSSPMDTATYISYLLNKSYFHLIMGEVEEEKSSTDRALKLSELFKEVPVLRSKVLLFAAANTSDLNDSYKAIEKKEKSLENIKSN